MKNTVTVRYHVFYAWVEMFVKPNGLLFSKPGIFNELYCAQIPVTLLRSSCKVFVSYFIFCSVFYTFQTLKFVCFHHKSNATGNLPW